MKKTTLFTTLALVVIVAIALSTATFAWYSANNAVSAGTSLQANAAGDSNLLISDKTDGKFATTLTIADKSTLQPACPISEITYAFDSTRFWNMKVNGENKVTGVGATDAKDIFVAPIVVKNDATTGQVAAHVKAAVTITPDATDSKGLTADDDIEWVLISEGDVIVASSAYDYAAMTTIATDGSVTDVTSYTSANAVSNDSKTVDIAAQGTKSFKLIIWLNKNVDNSNALGKMAVSVVFSTSAKELPTT